MLGVAFDQSVDVSGPIGRGTEQVIGEAPDLIVHFTSLCPERAANVVGALPAHVRLKEHLQSQFAGFSSSAQVSRQSFVVSRQASIPSLQEDSFSEARFLYLLICKIVD
jgi:hypothetical protein